MEGQLKNNGGRPSSLTLIGTPHWEMQNTQKARQRELEKVKEALAQERPNLIFLERREYSKPMTSVWGPKVQLMDDSLNKSDLVAYAHSIDALVLPLETNIDGMLKRSLFKDLEFLILADRLQRDPRSSPQLQQDFKKAARATNAKYTNKTAFRLLYRDLFEFLREKEWSHFMAKTLNDANGAKALAYVNEDSSEALVDFYSRTSGNGALKGAAVVGAKHLTKGKLLGLLRDEGIEPRVVDLRRVA